MLLFNIAWKLFYKYDEKEGESNLLLNYEKSFSLGLTTLDIRLVLEDLLLELG